MEVLLNEKGIWGTFTGKGLGSAGQKTMNHSVNLGTLYSTVHTAVYVPHAQQLLANGRGGAGRGAWAPCSSSGRCNGAPVRLSVICGAARLVWPRTRV